jgi:hypothetical protein
MSAGGCITCDPATPTFPSLLSVIGSEFQTNPNNKCDGEKKPLRGHLRTLARPLDVS